MATVDVQRVLTHHPLPVKAQRRKAWDAARTDSASSRPTYSRNNRIFAAWEIATTAGCLSLFSTEMA